MGPSHVRIIKKAADIASQVVEDVFLYVRPGMTEKEVASFIRKQIKKRGGEKESFRTIVASGRRAALIHGFATENVIRNGDLLMIDMGVVYKGLCSDITRTYYVDREGCRNVPESKASVKIKRIYNIVKVAQNKAMSAVRSGVSVAVPDKEVRKVFRRAGLEKYFTHSTGHGIGRKVHEEPRISSVGAQHVVPVHANNYSPVRFKSGEVITIEPGLYFKGWGGVRIEDMVLVTKRGFEILTW